MKKKSYRSLEEILPSHTERLPLSLRVEKSTRDILKAEAKTRKVTISTIAAAILDDYANWLISSNTRKNDASK